MNEKSIIVMGGSFNPPTIAHLRSMQKALDAVHAERGFFAPVSFPYLKRKMVKVGQSHLCLPDDLRLIMLKAMAESDGRIQIDTGEMKEPFAITSRTMERMQEAYPGARIYFVAGADKIDLLEEFQRKWDFLTKYGVIVISRNGGLLREQIAEHELLRAFQSSIVMVDPPAEMESVSSTRVREHLFDIEAVKGTDLDGNEISSKVEKESYEGQAYEFSSKEINGYSLSEVQGDETGNFGTSDKEIKYIYRKTSVALKLPETGGYGKSSFEIIGEFIFLLICIYFFINFLKEEKNKYGKK